MFLLWVFSACCGVWTFSDRIDAPPAVSGGASGGASGDSLTVLLAEARLSQYEGPLRALGVSDPSDLVDLTEGERPFNFHWRTFPVEFLVSTSHFSHKQNGPNVYFRVVLPLQPTWIRWA
jgi:hypothetical protein